MPQQQQQYYGQMAPQQQPMYHQPMSNNYQQMARPVNPPQALDTRSYGSPLQQQMPVQNRS